MPIKSAPYFFAKCDNCGACADYDGFTAFEDPGHAADMALDSEWTRAGEVFHCPACPPLGADEDTEVTSPADEPDALSNALMRSRPELTGHVHYVNGRPWCDGVNHTTMCQPESEEPDPQIAQPEARPAV